MRGWGSSAVCQMSISFLSMFSFFSEGWDVLCGAQRSPTWREALVMFSLRVLMLADPRCHRGVHSFGNAGFWKRVAWFSLLWPTLLETKEYHLFPCMDVPIGMNTLDAPMPLTHVLEPSYSTPECSPARWLGGRLPVRFGCKGSQQSRHGHVPETRKQTTTRAATEHSSTEHFVCSQSQTQRS